MKTETQPSTDTTKTEPKVEPKVEGTEDKPAPSLLNTEDKKLDDKTPAATDYKPFTVPEGYELVPEVAAEATSIFKELNLTQEQSQKLVDFYSKQVKSLSEASDTSADTAWTETNAEWQRQTMADPELGPHIGKVKETISRALDSLGDTAMTKDFKRVMDLTGAGNHPAFVKAFYKLASAVTEGRHVAGSGPSKFGQAAPGTSTKPSPAQALYPGLQSSNG